MNKDIIEFLCSLFGYLIRITEIHWNTESNSIHERCDDIFGLVKDCMDRIAECDMGEEDKKFRIGDLKPLLPNSNDLKKMLSELEGEAKDMRNKFSSNEHAGIENILGDLIEGCNKYKYRVTQK